MTRRSTAWPTPAQELLLKAALSRGQEAIDAWQAWNLVDDVQTTDPSSQRLLPLAYRSLANAGVEAAGLAKLKGTYRYSLYRNQILLHSGAGVLRGLADANIETMILEGPALATIYYRDRGARSMADFDVLVRTEDALGAMAVLRDNGWEPSVPRPESRLDARHADSFANADGWEIDLHWDLLWQVSENDDFWAGAVDTTLNGVPTKALCAADQLLHVCVHSLPWAPLEPIRWVADSMKVIEGAGSALDWDRVVRVARETHVTLAMKSGLAYLREAFGAPVPAEVADGLASSPRTRFERLEFRAGLSRGNRVVHLLMLWDRHRRVTRMQHPDTRGPGFATFLQQHWRLEHRSQIPLHVLSRVARPRPRQ